QHGLTTISTAVNHSSLLSPECTGGKLRSIYAVAHMVLSEQLSSALATVVRQPMEFLRRRQA
ncbi:MAG TPA: hypothetical protein VM842_02530, partial [Nitrospira sp.]|nr:hypothetical protein [Nitrospira sp.]